VKKYLFSAIMALFVSLVLAGCSFGDGTPISSLEDSSMPIRRYDLLQVRYLTTGDYSALQKMRTTYIVETRALVESLLKIGVLGESGMNERILEYYEDSTLSAAIEDVNKTFANMDKENEQLRICLNRMQRLLPEVELPDVYTQIGDFEQSIVVCGHRVGISLEKYLGTDYPVYKRFFDEQQRKQMTREYMIPECMSIYLLSQFPFGDDFQNTSQAKRDFHLQCVWYVVNKLLGEDFFGSSEISKVDAFMQSHKDMSLSELLNYSRREMSKGTAALVENAK
jgi:hypothetical protein